MAIVTDSRAQLGREGGHPGWVAPTRLIYNPVDAEGRHARNAGGIPVRVSVRSVIGVSQDCVGESQLVRCGANCGQSCGEQYW